MVTHVVMWKFLPEIERDQAYSRIRAGIEALHGVIPGLESIQLGLNVNDSDAAWDMALVSTHRDMDALALYQQHPDHVKVGALIREVVNQRAVVDFVR